MHRTLRKFNVVFVIINIIGALAGAIFCFSLGQNGVGFLSLIGGTMYSLFVYIILGTFAEIAENVEEIREESRRHPVPAAPVNPAFIPQPQAGRAVPQPVNNTFARPDPQANIDMSGAVVPKNSQTPGKIVCPQCGEVQRADRNLCWKCGVPFIRK